jgi:glycosyltransferase 2 family protein
VTDARTPPAAAGTAPSAPRSGVLRRLARTLPGYAFAAAGLAWVLHGVSPAGMARALRSTDVPLLIPAVAFDTLSYVVQGVRWRLLLRPAGRISTIGATRAVYAGLFTNEILPLRAGEWVRAFLAARIMNTGIPAVVPSMAVERLFDGIWVCLGLGLTAVFVPLPRSLLRAADALGVIVIAGLGLFVFLALSRRGRERAPADDGRPGAGGAGRVRGLIRRLVRGAADGVSAIGLSRAFAVSLLVSSLILILQMAAFWLVMAACGLDASFWEGAAVFLIVHFGTAIPNAPSNVGAYQFFTVLGLTLFGVEKTAAAGFSVAVFVILTVPLWVIGFLAVSRSGMTLAEIRSVVRRERRPGGG